MDSRPLDWPLAIADSDADFFDNCPEQGIVTIYFVLRYVVRRGFLDIYPGQPVTGEAGRKRISQQLFVIVAAKWTLSRYFAAICRACCAPQ